MCSSTGLILGPEEGRILLAGSVFFIPALLRYPSAHSFDTHVTPVGGIGRDRDRLWMSNSCFGRTDQCAAFCYMSDMYDMDEMLLGLVVCTEVMEMFDRTSEMLCLLCS
jgi:hypothetical protein